MAELPKWVWDLIADLLDEEERTPDVVLHGGGSPGRVQPEAGGQAGGRHHPVVPAGTFANGMFAHQSYFRYRFEPVMARAPRFRPRGQRSMPNNYPVVPGKPDPECPVHGGQQ